MSQTDYVTRALALLDDPPASLATDDVTEWPEHLTFVVRMPYERPVFAVLGDALGLVDHRARLAAKVVPMRDPVSELLGMRRRRGIQTQSGLMFTAATHGSPWTFLGSASPGMQRRLRGSTLREYAAAVLVATAIVSAGSAEVSRVTGRNIHAAIELPGGAGVTWDVTKPESAARLPADVQELPSVEKLHRPALKRGRLSQDQMILELYEQGILTKSEFERLVERAQKRRQ